MRENCTSGLMRGSNGNGDSRPLLSTLLSNSVDSRWIGIFDIVLSSPSFFSTTKHAKHTKEYFTLPFFATFSAFPVRLRSGQAPW